MNHWVD